MRVQGPFIGREKELLMIDEMVLDWGTNHVLPVAGKGGIGKTWLLRALYHRYESDPRVLPISLDYSQSGTQSLSALIHRFYNQLAPRLSPAAENHFHGIMSETRSLDMTADDVQKGYISLVDLINEETLGKRLLILSDTVEASIALDAEDRVNPLAARFSNAVVIIAGRPEEYVLERFKRYSSVYTGWTVHDVYWLTPFTTEEALECLHAVLDKETESELLEKVALLTGNSPVLVAIAAEWLKRNIGLPEDIDLPLADLASLDTDELSQRRRRFEFELVSRVRNLSHPVDQALLHLAYLNRRYDRKILQLALDTEDKNTLDAIESELKTMVFVRLSIDAEGGLLHDEAQRLICDYAWTVEDPDGTLRRALAHRVIDQYYLPEIRQLSNAIQEKVSDEISRKLRDPEHPLSPILNEEWLRQELQTEALDYYFRISAEKGWAYWDALFDEALYYRYSRVQMDAIMHAAYNLVPSEVESARFKVRVAQRWLKERMYDRAVQLAQTALGMPGIDSFDAAWAMIILGESTSDPNRKIDNFEAALQKAELTGDAVLEATILNDLGQAYRQQGTWPRAKGLYRQALGLFSQHEDQNLYANLLNNLAYVHMLEGNLERADNLAEKALLIRKEIGNKYGMGFSYSTKGHIAQSQGDYALALLYHRTAVDLFERIEDNENVAWAQINIAAAERRAQNFERARELLSPGLTSTRPHNRARALHQASKVDIDEVQALLSQRDATSDATLSYDNSIRKALEALILAQQTADTHLTAGILLDLALITFFKEQRKDEKHLEALQEILSEHDYPLEQARFTELVGDLAFVEKDTTAAFEHYLDACEALARYPASFRQTFDRVRAKFLDADLEARDQICQMIMARFATVSPLSALVALKDLCEPDF